MFLEYIFFRIEHLNFYVKSKNYQISKTKVIKLSERIDFKNTSPWHMQEFLKWSQICWNPQGTRQQTKFFLKILNHTITPYHFPSLQSFWNMYVVAILKQKVCQMPSLNVQLPSPSSRKCHQKSTEKISLNGSTVDIMCIKYKI